MVFKVSFIVERSDPERSVESGLILPASPDMVQALPLAADQNHGAGRSLVPVASETRDSLMGVHGKPRLRRGGT